MAQGQKRYLLRRGDNTVDIMCIARRPDRITISGVVPGEWPTAEECIAKLLPEHRIAIVSYREAMDSDFPGEGAFRRAWVDLNGKGPLTVDMAKAREIQRNILRSLRAPLLQGLDVETLKAVGADDAATVKSVEIQKQALRDVTDDPAIDAATTPEELKLIIPDILKG